MTRPQFRPEQAKLIAHAFAEEQVDYLFIGRLLERFREEYERLNSPQLRTAAEAARNRRKEP